MFSLKKKTTSLVRPFLLALLGLWLSVGNIVAQTGPTDYLSVTGIVPGSASDFTVTVAPTSPQSTYAQNTTIPFTLTYQSNLSSAAGPLTLVANWSRGTVSGDTVPTLDLLDYVDTSAGNAYGGAVPVIDLVNRTITWTITSLPTGVGTQTLNFSLKTNENYTGSSQVSLTVDASITNSGIISPATQQSLTYQYTSSSTSTSTTTTSDDSSTDTSTTTTTTSTSTSTTTVEPTSFIAPTTTPAVVTPEPVLSLIDIVGLTDTTAAIQVESNVPLRFSILYGTSIDNLDNRINAITTGNNFVFEVANLLKEDTYYFQIVARDENGNDVESQFYSFTTAQTEDVPIVENDSIVISSNDNVLLNPELTLDEEVIDYVVIPTQQNYEIKFKLANSENIDRIQLFLRDPKVQGITSYQKDGVEETKTAQMVALNDGWFKGRLLALDETKTYQIVARMFTKDGVINEQAISSVKYVLPLNVMSAWTEEPLEKARVELSYFNTNTQLYTEVSPVIYGALEPLYSEPDGNVDMVLPVGRYKATISSLGYRTKEVEFYLGKDDAQTYPVVTLELGENWFIALLMIIVDTAKDVFLFTWEFFETLGQSKRFFLFLQATVVVQLIVSILWLLFDWSIAKASRMAIDQEVAPVTRALLNFFGFIRQLLAETFSFASALVVLLTLITIAYQKIWLTIPTALLSVTALGLLLYSKYQTRKKLVQNIQS